MRHDINKAGKILKALDIGAVRIRYRPADELITADSFTLWIDATDDRPDIVGTGPTAEAALYDALAQRDGTKAAA